VVEVKTNAFLLAIIGIIILSITLFPSGITAQNSDSDYYNGDYWSAEGAIAMVHWTSGTANQFFELNEGHTSKFFTDTTNSTLKIHVDGPKEISYDHGNRDTLRCSMDYLTAVSYQASWENKEETQVYTNSTDNQTKVFDFELTNIPYGNNTLEVYASYVVSAFGPPLYSSLHMSTYTDYVFIVSPNTPTQTALPISQSISLEQVTMVSLLTIAVIVFVLILYKRHRRTTVDTTTKTV
jgi:hypothetical protein